MWAPGGDDLAAPEARERKWGASAAGLRGSAPSLRKTPDLPTPAWGPRGSGSQREAGRRAENVRVVSESVERDGKHSRTQRSAPFSSPRHRAAHPSPSALQVRVLWRLFVSISSAFRPFPAPRPRGSCLRSARAGEDVPTRRGGESPLPRTPSSPFSVPGFRQHAFNYYVAVAHWTDRFRAAVGTEVFSAPWLGPLIHHTPVGGGDEGIDQPAAGRGVGCRARFLVGEAVWPPPAPASSPWSAARKLWRPPRTPHHPGTHPTTPAPTPPPCSAVRRFTPG